MERDDDTERFRALFDNVVDGVYQASPNGEILSMNPALVRMLGYDAKLYDGSLAKKITIPNLPPRASRTKAPARSGPWSLRWLGSRRRSLWSSGFPPAAH